MKIPGKRKSARWVGAVIAVGLAIALALVFRDAELSTSSPAPARLTEAKPPKPPLSPSSVGSLSAEPPPSACEEQWSALLQLKPSEEGGNFEDRMAALVLEHRCSYLPESHPLYCAQFQFQESCGETIAKKNGSWHISNLYRARAASRCSGYGSAPFLGEGISPVLAKATLRIASARSPECADRYAVYRRAVADYLARDRPLSEIGDPETLTAMYLSAFQTGNKARAKEIAKRAAEAAPNDKLVARMWAFAEYTEQRDSSANELSAARGHLESVAPRDPYLAELNLEALRLRGNYSELRRVTEAAAEDDLGAKYYLAWAMYLQKDLSRAGALLKELVRRQPQEARVLYSQQLFEHGLVGSAGDRVFLSRADDPRFGLSGIESALAGE